MRRASRIIAAAYALDLAFGDPAWLPHPVRAIGAAIAAAERRWNGVDANARLRGSIVAVAIIGGTAVIADVAVRAVRRFPRPLGFALEALLGATTLATTDLVREATSVAEALEAGDLERARQRVARIVGRDTHDLDAHEIARAAIETLAESTCDGIVAPLFWFALGGVPGALAFKAASTLDSMIGHREPRYARFGAASARIDDVVNFLPARAAAFIAAGASPAPRVALRCVRRDARAHASPNAGWPEAAFAGALGVRLGGTNRYAGVAHAGAILNAAGSPPRACDVRRAIRLVRRTSALAAMVALVLSRRSPRAR